jgi:hypothetical protein
MLVLSDSGNREGMDTGEDEPNCVKIDITAEQAATLPRVRDLLGLPPVEGPIDATQVRKTPSWPRSWANFHSL